MIAGRGEGTVLNGASWEPGTPHLMFVTALVASKDASLVADWMGSGNLELVATPAARAFKSVSHSTGEKSNVETSAREMSHSSPWLREVKATIASVCGPDRTGAAGASLLLRDARAAPQNNEREAGGRNASFACLFLSKQCTAARQAKAGRA